MLTQEFYWRTRDLADTYEGRLDVSLADLPTPVLAYPLPASFAPPQLFISRDDMATFRELMHSEGLRPRERENVHGVPWM